MILNIRLIARMHHRWVALLLLLVGTLPTAAQTNKDDSRIRLTRAEAEILIYIMPISKQIRRDGFDVGWEVREGDDAFHFHVYNSKRKCSQGCSLTVGNYTVNRVTFAVTDDSEKPVTSREMSGVQKILRREHQGQSKAD